MEEPPVVVLNSWDYSRSSRGVCGRCPPLSVERHLCSFLSTYSHCHWFWKFGLQGLFTCRFCWLFHYMLFSKRFPTSSFVKHFFSASAGRWLGKSGLCFNSFCCLWLIKSGEKCSDLMNAIIKVLRSGFLLHKTFEIHGMGGACLQQEQYSVLKRPCVTSSFSELL